MKQLEERVYTKAEMAEILGINPKDKNFKRNVENTLTKWGYDYEFPPYSKTITITYIPDKATNPYIIRLRLFTFPKFL